MDKKLIIELLSHPSVKRHMPLSSERFEEKEVNDFIEAKEKIWDEYGFGPTGYFVDGAFIGWAGIQPDEGKDFEMAIVLHPEHWGYGIQIYKELIQYAFDALNLEAITIYFPPSRTKIKGIIKAGFIKNGETTINGTRFIRYRLINKNVLLKSKIIPSTPLEAEFIDHQIVAFNRSKVPFTQETTPVFKNYVIKEKEVVIAGINALIYHWGILYIDVLFVDPQHRGKSLGSTLLERVENDAKAMGATLSHLDTFDFQAHDFYLKRGYQVFGVLENCPTGHKRYYLSKSLLP